MTSDFELVQVHEVHTTKDGEYAEVVIRDKNGCLVYAGNLPKQNNPRVYYMSDESMNTESRIVPAGTMVKIEGIPFFASEDIKLETHPANWDLIKELAQTTINEKEST